MSDGDGSVKDKNRPHHLQKTGAENAPVFYSNRFSILPNIFLLDFIFSSLPSTQK